MDNHFKFLTLPKATGNVANIFIHGYSAGHDLDDRRLLANSIPGELRQSVNVLAFWPSSHFAQLDNRSRGLLMAAARFHPLAAAAALAGDRALHFARIRARAEAMGKVLLTQLAQYLAEHHPEITRINLIGHSLGGRLLVSALRQLGSEADGGLSVGDVLLMGAAVRVEADEAACLRPKIHGRLINAYSRDDQILLLNLGERSLGRTVVEHFDNVCMQGFGHNHYWKRLGEVLVACEFSGFREPMAGSELLRAVDLDPVLQDAYLHSVLERSPDYLLDAAIKHLSRSRWTRLKDSDADRTYAFVREFQLVGGHFLLNAARRRGVSYTRVLNMLARQYGLDEALHQCASVIEVEALLLRSFFRHAFVDEHPVVQALVQAPRAIVRAMPWAVYAGHVDALAERLTVATSLKSAAAGKVPVQRLVARLGSALRPGYSALIPTVAIVFYARVMLDDEGLM
ncbi:DUF726 domain-containing protein [Pseudomonas sp. 3A(2025)]